MRVNLYLLLFVQEKIKEGGIIMKFISKNIIAFFLIIVTIIQVFLVVSASNSFEVKCTIEDIKKSEVSVEVYDITEFDETIVKKDSSQI